VRTGAQKTRLSDGRQSAFDDRPWFFAFWSYDLKTIIALLLLLPLAARAETLTVFAAASMTNAMQDIGTLWQAAGHPKIAFSFASSSVLALQIEHGAPANLFISADEKWMDELAAHNLIVGLSRSDLVGNTLVLVEPNKTLKPIDLAKGTNLMAVLGRNGRLAVGDPGHVPAGIYAKQALTALGLWPSLKAHLAPADSVRSALRLVETGEAPAGIVYGTDVKIAPLLGVAGTFPAATHDPIRYPTALVAANNTADARAFLAFIHTPAAEDVFSHYGFTPP
jgi:molybdate transport system substrate-binding protein